MKTLLHIGTEKTGSTSFQNWASRNRDALADRGVWYSQVLGRLNHIKIYLWALPEDSTDNGYELINADAPAGRAAFRANLPDQLAAEYAAARARGCHTFLISNEHCHSRLVTPEAVARVRALLEPLSSDIEVLCYLRPQIDMAVSMASTAARVRLRVDRDWFARVTPTNVYYDYLRLYRRWADVFGDAAVTLTGFKRNADTVAHVCAKLGLDTAGLAPAARLNEALDIRTIAIQNVLSDQGYLPGHPIYRLTRFPIDLLRCDERLQIGPELARQIQDPFEESNRELSRLRPEITPEDLLPDWSRYDGACNLDQLDGDCGFGPKLAETLILMNMQNRISTVNMRIAQAERAIWADNVDNACKLYDDACAMLDGLPADMDAFMNQRNSAADRLAKLAGNNKLSRALAAR
ncbi:hypothetical protein [Marinibacterium sp. SX1]|uniref:hypothetical protein n=1 Tax=Marinibacterium sp. SX1 TaxID=3388424 RepID=UPI003D177A9F